MDLSFFLDLQSGAAARLWFLFSLEPLVVASRDLEAFLWMSTLQVKCLLEPLVGDSLVLIREVLTSR